MSNISANAVKELRDRTNAPYGACKVALTEAGGDMEKAVEILRSKNAAIAGGKVDRETAEGRIAIAIDPAKKTGAILEMRCESAPVAKGEHFVALADEIAKQAAQSGTTDVAALLNEKLPSGGTVSSRIHDVIGLIRENMKPARVAVLKGEVGGYVHHDGSTGALVLVEGTTKDPQVLRDVAMHITALRPVYARREDVPADVMAKELDIAKQQIAADPKNASKPANIVEKIAEGKVKTWLGANVLNEQPFVKDDKKTIGDLLKAAGLKLVRFVRYKVGELS
jgi:elongation factor Ts